MQGRYTIINFKMNLRTTLLLTPINQMLPQIPFSKCQIKRPNMETINNRNRKPRGKLILKDYKKWHLELRSRCHF